MFIVKQLQNIKINDFKENLLNCFYSYNIQFAKKIIEVLAVFTEFCNFFRLLNYLSMLDE